MPFLGQAVTDDDFCQLCASRVPGHRLEEVAPIQHMESNLALGPDSRGAGYIAKQRDLPEVSPWAKSAHWFVVDGYQHLPLGDDMEMVAGTFLPDDHRAGGPPDR